MKECADTVRLTDFCEKTLSSADFFNTSAMKLRETSSLEAKLVYDFNLLNREVLSHYKVSVSYRNNGHGGGISFRTSDYVGAFPLRSPQSGKWDIRIVINPRIGWSSLGGVLATMGWKVLPELQRLPMFPQSAKEIPSWVIASVIIARITGLLKDVTRKYIPKSEVLQSPKGRIDWNSYVSRQIPQCGWTDVPCDFTELGSHPELMGVIRYTVEKVIRELASNNEGGAVMMDILERAKKLLRHVACYAPIKPIAEMLSPLFYGRSHPTESFSNGIEAIQWSEENRGLAGLSNLRGIPWRMSISEFFEAYVETIVKRAALYTGGQVTCGRSLETVIPIIWEDSLSGTQKTLKPDVVLRRDDEVIIVDAKFKGYWRQIFRRRWEDVDDEFREEHRNDFLQVLAYSTCFSTSKVTVCLVYACEQDDYNALREKGLLHRRARIGRPGCTINLILTLVPMQGNIDIISQELAAAWAE